MYFIVVHFSQAASGHSISVLGSAEVLLARIESDEVAVGKLPKDILLYSHCNQLPTCLAEKVRRRAT